MLALLAWLRSWLLMGIVQVGLVQEGSVELVLRESAVLARWETVVVAPAGGTLRWMVESGERVRVGTVVAELENRRAMADAHRDLAALEGQLSMMDLAQAPRRQAVAERRAALRSQVAATVRELRAAILAGDTSAVVRGEAGLRELLRHYRAAEDENLALTRELALLEQRVIAQRDFLEGLAVQLAAPKAGVVNLELDGLEQVVTPRQLVEMSAARLANLAVRPSRARDGQEVRAATPLFKVMDTGETYLALVVSASRGAAFPEKMEVRFTDLGSLPVPASLQYRGTPEPNDSMLIVLRVGPAPDELAGMRQAAVEVVLDRWRGPAVDRRALVEREGVMGVMAVIDGTARFRGVDVLGGDERRVVVRGIEMGQEIVLNPWLVREDMRIR
ncbi:MAG TPA: HlyD family efflux transporter periplasmic adaptor subunit [Bacillota bacterium]|nr:HlyD family efflux transporter periplasmic adaptor subunit [Bacillota bacterium]